MIGYKVVRDFDGKHLSYSSPKIVVYEEGKWVFNPSNCGPLLLFGSKQSAKYFLSTTMEDLDFVSCWEAEYVPSKSTKIHIDGKYEVELSRLIDGTVMADKVKLLKRIWSNDGLVGVYGNWL